MRAGLFFSFSSGVHFARRVSYVTVLGRLYPEEQWSSPRCRARPAWEVTDRNPASADS